MDDTRKLLNPPDPSRVMEGLRDTGYDFNTAIADIIDNSIAAKADIIAVNVVLTPDGEILVFFADNGCGMDEDGLLNAMRYGSKRRDDPGSLGKFGLGLKTASSAFCRCLSVISRNSGEVDYKKAQWDLDFIAQTGDWFLKMPNPSEEEIEVLQEVAQGSGTLVIWDKVDRVLSTFKRANGMPIKRAHKKLCDELEEHISMVYQRFLDAEDLRERTICINLNGNKIQGWDPFCVSEMTEMVASEEVAVDSGHGDDASFLVRAFVLPRREEFSTEEALKKSRLTNDMQGFYIYRENRLIHFGDWLSMFSKEPHGTLLRVEFSFDHRLDEAFNIDIKKSRIMLNEEIYNWIRDSFIAAPRRAADERYRLGTKKKVEQAAQDAHDTSNKVIDSKASEVQQSSVTITDAANNEVLITNREGSFKHKLVICKPDKPGQVRIVPVDSIDDGMLWEPCLVDGKTAIRLNCGHQFYHKIYVPNLSSGVLVQGMDALLWSLGVAELSTFNKDTREQYEELRMQVSRSLRKLVSDLPEPDLSEVMKHDVPE